MITTADIQAFQARKTPFYHYDLKQLRALAIKVQNEARSRNYHVHYALKANARPEVLDVFVNQGFGADCVSGAEVRAALEAGFASNHIAFAGVGKTDDEIDLAIEQDIFTLNVESIEELEVISSRAVSRGKTARIALRLNPDVDANTHRYITTGLEENKFGISGWQIAEVMDLLRSLKGIELTGLHFHIGSQIQNLEPFRNLCGRINHFQQVFSDHGFHIQHINAGGGLGVNYDQPDELQAQDFEEFFSTFDQLLELRPGQELHFELGRALVAHCGDLISRALYVKRGQKTDFLILDAGMTELIRPALYQAFHSIQNLSNSESKELHKYDVVGPVCESSDSFGKAVLLPECRRGDLIAIRMTGAYGESMASNYNLRQLETPYFRG